MDDVKLAVETLQSKQALYTPLFDYYAGNQPIRYAAERLRDIFQNAQTRFTENWCAVVVDAVCDRLEINGWTADANDALSERLNLLWRSTGLAQEEEAVNQSVAITGEAYVLAWPGEQGPEAFYHDPRVCHVWYAADNPRQKRMAAKWWRDDEGTWRLNLYYPELIQHWAGGTGDLPQANSFTLVSEETNAYGVVPVFHLYRARHLLHGELINVLPPQDAINKLLADMMIAAEFGAFRQRWIITNSDTSKLRNAPNEIWEIPASAPGDEPTKVGEFNTTDLGNYLNAIDKLAAAIGIITQTPRHYFFLQGGDPSGESLIAAEAPLNRKGKKYQKALGYGWSQVAAFLLELDGSAVNPLDITPLWEPTETVQPRTQAEIRQMDTASGIPLVTQLRDAGWTDADLAQMAADKAEADVAQQAQLASAMTRAQRSFDQNAQDDGEGDGRDGNDAVMAGVRNGATTAARRNGAAATA